MNLDLLETYYRKGRFQFYDAYHKVPFKVSFIPDHPQPLNIIFNITFLNDVFHLEAESKIATFYNFKTNSVTHEKERWVFKRNGRIGELIETPDLAFIIEAADSTQIRYPKSGSTFGFDIKTLAEQVTNVKGNLNFSIADRQATIIQINYKSESQKKGIDIVDELMYVYSQQNLERKNHIASVTIEYIESQLNEISDSLNQAENNLQRFRSSKQLLSITDQAAAITVKHSDLQTQLAELVTRKRYYDHVSDLLRSDNYSKIILPSSIGIEDALLNSLMSELITFQAQRSNLIENNQERNPLVAKLTIQIENLKKTISDNIISVANTNDIAIDEMERRIRATEEEISRIPATQRQLGNFERQYRLNDAIYNYLLEKHAEAKITKASNLPDDVVIEHALSQGQISPNTRKNYLIAFLMGLAIPFGFLIIRAALNNKIRTQSDIEQLTDRPVLGKILHNSYKTSNVVFEYPKSNIAESFRTLRTNLEFFIRGEHKKVILISSCFENEGKSFVALNLAMSYAQLGRRSILVDFNLRKPKIYFKEQEEYKEGLSSYLINEAKLEDIIRKSPHDKLDYILAGIIPPNPVELVALEKTEQLIAVLRKDYDIIILDVTPLAQVTDAYLLLNHSELKILISRQNTTIKKVFSTIMKDLQQKNVKDLCIVINDNRFYNDQYGYGYGYYRRRGIFGRKIKTGESGNII